MTDIAQPFHRIILDACRTGNPFFRAEFEHCCIRVADFPQAWAA
jgi:hypothetical protein